MLAKKGMRGKEKNEGRPGNLASIDHRRYFMHERTIILKGTSVPVLILEEACFVLGLKHPPRSEESSRESMPGDGLKSLNTCT